MSKSDSAAGAQVPPKKDDKKDDKKKKAVELSEEDIQKKEELELLVNKAGDSIEGVAKLALETIRSEIRSSTSSMTSIPKALKFMRVHFDTLKSMYDTFRDNENRKLLADILSVLAMTMPENEGMSLKFKLNGTKEALDLWGHEYVRNLTAEIRNEFERRTDAGEDVTDLLAVVDEIAPFHMHHHAEPDAVDLLLEIEKLDKIVSLTDDQNFKRVCRYLVQCSMYLPDPEDTEALRVARSIYLKHHAYADALLLALKLGDSAMVQETYDACTEKSARHQLALILGRHGVLLDSESDETTADLMRGARLSEHFLALAADLDVMEPKTPDDIYKMHLDTQPAQFQQVDAARNLASTFVNAFVNAGFRRDKLALDDKGQWIHQHRDMGLTSAAASLGLLQLWDVEAGLTNLTKYMYIKDDKIRAGAFMGMGIVTCGVRNAADPALALLSEPLDDPTTPAPVRIGCIVGLGLAYAGTGREEVLEILRPIVEDADTGLDTVSHACLALGQVFCGTAHGEVAQALLTVLMERAGPAAEANSLVRFVALGLGLLFLGRGDNVAEATLLALEAVPDALGKYAALTVETCASAFSGDVLKVQKMLGVCADALHELHAKQQAEVDAKEAEASGNAAAAAPAAGAGAGAGAGAAAGAGAEGDKTDEKTDLYSVVPVAVLGITLAAMNEDVGCEMALRSFGHLLQYGDTTVRRVVPLALGLLSVSNPQISVTDTLSKLSHDNDAEVAQGAILGLGFVGAGTNNARIAGLLRQLALYYQRDAQQLLAVRMAQGLLHLGKGTIGLAPYHSERFLMQPAALAGLLTVMHAGFDMKNLLLGRAHYLLFHIAPAMYPRMLLTVDESLKPLPVPVRVGQAVDTVGQAGHPKTITGFQTHTAPVLLSHGERAELATAEYLPLTPVLEGVVILRPNPDYKPPK